MKLILCLLSAPVLGMNGLTVRGSATAGSRSAYNDIINPPTEYIETQEWVFKGDYDAIVGTENLNFFQKLFGNTKKSDFLTKCSAKLSANSLYKSWGKCSDVKQHNEPGYIILNVKFTELTFSKDGFKYKLDAKKSEVQENGLKLDGFPELSLARPCGEANDICKEDERCWLTAREGTGADTTLTLFGNEKYDAEVHSCQVQTGEMMQAPRQSDLPLGLNNKNRYFYYNSEISNFSHFEERKVTGGRDSHWCKCTKVKTQVPDDELVKNQKKYDKVGDLRFLPENYWNARKWAWWVNVTNKCYHDDACQSGLTCDFSSYDFKRTGNDQSLQEYTISGKCVPSSENMLMKNLENYNSEDAENQILN